jgi:hypothetical protein
MLALLWMFSKADEVDSGSIEARLDEQVMKSFVVNVPLTLTRWQQRLKVADTPF